ncbi:NAD-dependent epimerase/dehydratase family protein [Sorangium sp. So ce233]|uniref:NAD-dependent epimerase/dehydratase family protein n=1 Tax=Sorangium sp. So ce233 TaxID=3133290 RepID=UPI003F5D5999
MERLIEDELRSLAGLLGDVARRLEGKTVLITGAAGFLGSYIVGVLQELNRSRFERPAKIVALDNLITGTKDSGFFDLDDPNLVFETHDVTRPYPRGVDPDFILHGAGIASPVYYARYPLETITVAVDGIRNVLDLARRARPEAVLYFSSSEIYGDPHPEFIPTPEDYPGRVSPTGLRACYDESKRLGETLAMVYHRQYGVPVTVVRPFNVYGPGMRRDDSRVLPSFLNAALDRRPIEIHRGGTQTRTFCYATDGVNGFLRVLLLGRPGEVYNIGSDAEEISMRDLAKKVEQAVGEPLDLALASYPEGYPVGDPNRRCPDITKARRELGYAPTVSLAEGLPRMLAWYRLLRKTGAPGGAR